MDQHHQASAATRVFLQKGVSFAWRLPRANNAIQLSAPFSEKKTGKGTAVQLNKNRYRCVDVFGVVFLFPWFSQATLSFARTSHLHAFAAATSDEIALSRWPATAAAHAVVTAVNATANTTVVCAFRPPCLVRRSRNSVAARRRRTR